MPQEGVAVADGTAQDTANDIARFLVARQLTVGNGKGDGSDMVGNHTHGDIRLLLFAVLATAYIAYLVEHRLEHIGVVVRLLALQGAYQTLKAHTRIDYSLRQAFQ